jgi:hypothetical protein
MVGRGTLTALGRALGLPAGTVLAHQYPSVSDFLEIFSRNTFKVPKFIENTIKLKKYKINFFVFLFRISL